jgi:hypothetical protein
VATSRSRSSALHRTALGEPGSGAETYPGLLRTTSMLITEALAAPSEHRKLERGREWGYVSPHSRR